MKLVNQHYQSSSDYTASIQVKKTEVNIHIHLIIYMKDEEQFKLTNVMVFHFLEMGQLIKHWKENKLDPWNNALAKWLLLLGMVDSRNGKVYEDIYHELEEIAMEDESLREVFHNWEELSMEQEQRQYYDARLKRIMDEEAAQRVRRNYGYRKQRKKQSKKHSEKQNKEQKTLLVGCWKQTWRLKTLQMPPD